jgi:hypothetical protein
VFGKLRQQAIVGASRVAVPVGEVQQRFGHGSGMVVRFSDPL